MTPVIGTSTLSGRILPTSRPLRSTSLKEFRKSQNRIKTNITKNNTNNSNKTTNTKRAQIKQQYGTTNNRKKTYNNCQKGVGILFKVPPRPRTATATRTKTKFNSKPKSRQRPGTATRGSTNNIQKSFVAERRVSITNSTFKQYRHPVRVDNHLPDTYKRYDLQGRRLTNTELAAKEKQNLKLDTVFKSNAINPHDLEPKPGAYWPNAGDLIKICKAMPSTGWVRVAPNEIGLVLDAGHVTVKAMFASGLGVPWIGEKEDVVVMQLKEDIRANVVGDSLVSRLRGLPETANRGRKSVQSFYGNGFYAARRRGGGMVRARIIVPHEYIGACGFVIPNYVHSVDAVNYTDEEGCTMYVTMKPGDEKELIPVIQKQTNGTGTITITPKQYNEGWAYYPSVSQIGLPHPGTKTGTGTKTGNKTGNKTETKRGTRTGNRTGTRTGTRTGMKQSTVPPSPGIVEIEASHLSDAASIAYHEDFTGTHSMNDSEKQVLLRKLCKQCQSGNARKVRNVLDVSPEVVEWKNQRGRDRTLLHYAGLGGSLKIVKLLLRNGADTSVKDIDGERPIDLVEKYIDMYLTTPKDNTPIDPHAKRRYRMCRALLSTTTIHSAAQEGDVDRVAFLVREYGDLLSATNKYGMTPLHYAAMGGHVNVCRVLSDLGADWMAKNNVGQTSVDVTSCIEIVNMFPERLRDEKWMSQAEEFSKLRQQGLDKQSSVNRSRALQWVRGTSAASIIAEGNEIERNSQLKLNAMKRNRNRKKMKMKMQNNQHRNHRNQKHNESISSSSLRQHQHLIPGSGLERGGSALSALPGLDYPSILQPHHVKLSDPYSRKSPNPYSSQWHGSSGLHGSKNKLSVRSSISNFEEPSINFKGKAPWWDKQIPKKHEKLPKTNSISFEKDLRRRYGHVKC